ncbi:MAG: 16S rRNA (cytosine(1402)-N(4))-methyltransferase RsmH [Spirochaetota bacterium]
MEPVHRSVLVEEVVTYLEPTSPGAVLVDATLGEGGHSARFLEQFPSLSVVGIDADAVMQARAAERLAAFGERVTLVNSWFDDFFATTTLSPDRILMDLGVSMYHFSLAGRGFSFRADEPLDMRLSDGLERSAADLVNELPEEELANLIYRYGEERLSRRIAARIADERAQRRLTTTKELADAIWRSVPASYRHGRLHPATRTFQALRIAVNGELDRVERAIPLALGRLPVGGRLAIISFHSLEDRIVKHRFREHAADGPFAVLTKKPIVPSESESSENPAARSAKLRVIERTGAAA